MSFITKSGYKLRYKEDDAIEVGLDEAGRGCLFGRLYTGAVVFSNDIEDFPDGGKMLDMIKDSKKVSQKKRDLLYDYIIENALDTCVAWAEVDEIDRDNILQADLSAMHRALDGLNVPVERVLADGDHWRPYRDTEGFAIIDGDAQYLSIAAAGILAKVSRDRWVCDIVAKHPEWDTQYGFSNNMGYGTPQHMKGLVDYGATAQHRSSFAPVRKALGLPEKEKKTKKGDKIKNGWVGVNEE